MLGDMDTTATIAVKDIRLAREFYEGTLGLTLVPAEETGVLLYMSGSSMIRIYESKHASTKKARPFSWAIGDEIDGVLQALKSF
jgi:catechol-2,3-dioxygenase